MNNIICGESLSILKEMESESIHCCVTSPPYFGLRNYGNDAQIGLEKTPEEYVQKLVEVFREVKRVLRNDAILFLNLGDSYNGSGGQGTKPNIMSEAANAGRGGRPIKCDTLKPKDLIGIPWRVAFALQADGWHLRQDIIWNKPNPMPESVTDRCTKAHEYIFLLSKSAKYYFDHEAIKEPAVGGQSGNAARFKRTGSKRERAIPNQGYGTHRPNRTDTQYNGPTRNKRSVWAVATKSYKEAHFATFPTTLIEPCVLAGCPKDVCSECGAPLVRVVEKNNPPNDGTTSSQYAPGMAANRLAMKRQAARERGEEDTNRSKTVGFKPTCPHGAGTTHGVVLDPFFGAGTTGLVAIQNGRDYVGIELNPDYVKIANDRIFNYVMGDK